MSMTAAELLEAALDGTLQDDDAHNEQPDASADDVPAVAVQAQAAPEAQQNTSPAFPPVPDNGTSPMQGIETPATADNLPQGIEQ